MTPAKRGFNAKVFGWRSPPRRFLPCWRPPEERRQVPRP
jgi:hypothetical protein